MPNQILRGWISDYTLLIILAVLLSFLWTSAPEARGLLPLDVHVLDQVQQFNREPMPERVIHTKSFGAYGTLTVTNDVAPCGPTPFLSEIGEQTETFESFFAMAAERGDDDEREVRSFTLKIDIAEGKVDIRATTFLCSSLMPWKIIHFLHTQKCHPQTDLLD